MTWGRKKNQRVLQTLGLMKQLPFQHLYSEDIRKLSVFKPVAIQYIFSTLSNLKKILNNVEISNATNYNSKLMNCSQKKNKLQTSVSVFCSNRPRESSNALWYLWDKNFSFSEVVRELSVSENLINLIMKYFKWILPLHYYLLSKYYYHFFYITCTCTLFCK